MNKTTESNINSYLLLQEEAYRQAYRVGYKLAKELNKKKYEKPKTKS